MAFSVSLTSPVCLHNANNAKATPRSRTFTHFAIPPLSTTAADFASIDGTAIAFIGGSSVAALAAVLTLTDPVRRRQLQAEEVGGRDKEVVSEYFNNSGFQRWKKIYGETDDVNKVQRYIRLGHSNTVENVMKMLTDEGSIQGVTVCDARCGTGCLAIPLAREGAVVYASDISKATRAYLHAEADVEGALRKVGWKIRKRGLTTTQLYFARLVEAVPA